MYWTDTSAEFQSVHGHFSEKRKRTPFPKSFFAYKILFKSCFSLNTTLPGDYQVVLRLAAIPLGLALIQLFQYRLLKP